MLSTAWLQGRQLGHHLNVCTNPVTRQMFKEMLGRKSPFQERVTSPYETPSLLLPCGCPVSLSTASKYVFSVVLKYPGGCF